MAQHTPGEWFACGWNNLTVNAAETPTRPECTIVLMPGGSRNATLEELQANALLIAAAPNLLACLRNLLSEITQSEAGLACTSPLAREHAAAAIATAEVQS
jgi:hypothetical protein